MKHPEIYNPVLLMELIQQIGFLPLLDSGIFGYSAEEVVSEDCRYVTFSEGGWDWPLWKWKGPIVSEGGCMYGKFFATRRASSVVSGGPISATIAATNTLRPRREVLRRPFC